MKALLLVATIIIFAVPAHSIGWFAVSPSKMDEYLNKCTKKISVAQMKKDIKQTLDEQRYKVPTLFGLAPQNLFGYKLPTKLTIKNVSLDGMKMSEINPYDLEIIIHLTMNRDAFNPIWKDDYAIVGKQIDEGVQIYRRCLSVICKSRKTEDAINLSKYMTEHLCSDALCASEKIFGKTKGIKILWVYLKYGLNLSPFSDNNADPGGFDNQSLDAIIAAAGAVPEHLRDATMKDSGFYRFLKGYTLKMYNNNGLTIANALGAVFDIIDDFNYSEKVYIFSHELGHRASFLDYKELAKSEEWMSTTGWREIAQKESVNNNQSGWVSQYAKTNPAEDFAESYAMYRFDPQRLKQISPQRYQFMKNQIFKNIEYDQDLCRGKVSTNQIIHSPIKNMDENESVH